MRLIVLFILVTSVLNTKAQNTTTGKGGGKAVEIKMPEPSQIVTTTDPLYLKPRFTGTILMPDSSQMVTETDPRHLRQKLNGPILMTEPSQIVTETDPAYRKTGVTKEQKTDPNNPPAQPVFIKAPMQGKPVKK